jgi:hypothetical protein
VVTQKRDIGDSLGQLVSFGEDPSGELYAVDHTGAIYKVIAATPTTTTTVKPAPKPAGYYLAAADGRVFGYGTARACAASKSVTPAVGIGGNRTGYWTVTSSGAVTACRSSVFGSLSTKSLAQPIVGIAAKLSGTGYWLDASDGGVFAFGDARFFGSTGNIRLAKPVVGMAATPSGKGYWLIASDGGVFAFGDARFFGSTGHIRLAKPVVGFSPTASGKGYWFVASDGGVFAYGDARYAGSAVAAQTRVVGIAHN